MFKYSIPKLSRVSISSFFNSILYRAKAKEYTFVVVLAVIIGILGGFGAIAFRYLIRFFQWIFFGSRAYTLQYVYSLPWYWKLAVPAIGGLIVGLIVYFFAREAKGHGVPEVMEASTIRGGVIRPRVTVVKAFASAICIGSGGSVGREGPIVQIGSALGSTLGQIIKVNPQTLRILVSCGAAAGIAATFNAPVAGALFAVEVILGDFGIARFSPIVISSVMATVISRHFLGDSPAFIIPAYELVSPWELVFYLGLGLLAGIVSVAFVKCLYSVEDFFDFIKFPEYLKPLLGGFIIGGIGIFFPQIFGVGYEAIGEALEGNMVWHILLILIALKLIATSVTLGSGGSGGIFAPSLFLGAMTGGFIGTIVHNLFPSITAGSGAYALVAMGAIVAGATHAPITAILIIFELTSNYHIILPLMITCIISTLLSTRLQADSIYTLKLHRRGTNIFRRQELNVLKSLKVKDVMTHDVELIPDNTILPVLLDRVMHSSHQSFFVTHSENRELEGVITMQDLRLLFMERESLSHLIIAQDIANPDIARVLPEDSLDLVMRLFGEKNMDELPVVDKMNPRKIVGSIEKHVLIEAYNRELFKMDILDGVARRIPTVEKERKFELIEGYNLTEIEAPISFVGKTLRELEVRKRYGIEIILIKRNPAGATAKPGTSETEKLIEFIPDPDNRIQPGDSFLVVGQSKNIERLRYI